MRRNAQSGFSLIELMVAMVVTLFIVGAVVVLLTGGQSSFKHQPERTDRQQNIRVAMDVIMRDIGAAGVGMPVFMQTFQRNLNNVGPAVAGEVACGDGAEDTVAKLDRLHCQEGAVAVAQEDTDVALGWRGPG